MPAAVPTGPILDATVQVIMDSGYEQATIAQIAAVAGVGEATLFRRFGDKDSLLRAALRAEVDRFAHEAIAHTGDVVADLEQAVRAYSDLMARRGPLILELVRVLPRRPELAMMGALPAAGISEVVAMVARYQATGTLRGERPWEATLALLGPILAAAAVAGVNPSLPVGIDTTRWVQDFLQGWRT